MTQSLDKQQANTGKAKELFGGKRNLAGRRKGVLNKINADVKQMVLHALNEVGGVEYLAKQAEENPVAFMALLGKILPLQVKSEVEHSGNITVVIQQF